MSLGMNGLHFNDPDCEAEQRLFDVAVLQMLEALQQAGETTRPLDELRKILIKAVTLKADELGIEMEDRDIKATSILAWERLIEGGYIEGTSMIHAPN